MSADHDIVVTRQEIYMRQYNMLAFCGFLCPISLSSSQLTTYKCV